MKTGKPLTEVEVLDFLKGRLGKVEVPKNVVFADPLPRNAAGKVFKNILGQNISEKIFLYSRQEDG